MHRTDDNCIKKKIEIKIKCYRYKYSFDGIAIYDRGINARKQKVYRVIGTYI